MSRHWAKWVRCAICGGAQGAVREISLNDATPHHSHDTASGTAAGVARLERVGVAALAEVIDALVDDDGAADDRVGAEEGDAGVCRGVGSQQEAWGAVRCEVERMRAATSQWR